MIINAEDTRKIHHHPLKRRVQAAEAEIKRKRALAAPAATRRAGQASETLLMTKKRFQFPSEQQD
jgi:hypothetical protein